MGDGFFTGRSSAISAVMAARSLLASAHHIKTLNVAGPRESKRPGIYQQTTALLEAVDKALFEDVP